MSSATPTIFYPESDGLPMAENTVQFDWISLLKWNLDVLFRAREDVFVAGDNFIYPVEGDNKLRLAPDVYRERLRAGEWSTCHRARVPCRGGS